MNKKNCVIFLLLSIILFYIITNNLNKPETSTAQIVSMPGDELKTIDFQPLHQAGIHPASLDDMVSHLPKNEVNNFKFSERVTWCHECSHGVSAYLRNNICDKNKKQQGLYIFNNKAVILDEPKVTLKQAAEIIPSNMRGTRYQLYFIKQQSQWNNLAYIWDEGNAYINQAFTAVELGSEKTGSEGTTDDVVAGLEFINYYIGTTLAIEKHDPEYLKNYKQYKEFLAHEIRREAAIYKKGIKIPRYNWKNDWIEKILNCKEYNNLLFRLYGDKLILHTIFKESEP